MTSARADDRPPMVLRASWLRTREVLRPPPPLTISQWSDKFRVLGPNSPLPGQWRTDAAPFLREPMDCLSPDSGVELVVIQKPVQVGCTEILLNAAAYYLVHCPSTVLIVEPNDTVVKRLSRQRIDPLIELCPPLKTIVSKAHGKGGNEMSLKTTTNGAVLALASAQSAAQLRSLPARIVLCDECDAYLKDLGEGNPFDLASARATTFGSLRRIAAVSTPTEAGVSLIDRLYRETDQRKWFVPCPYCGCEQILEWSGMRWEPGQPDTARYGCAGCGCDIEPGKKAAMVAAGKWKPTFATRSSGVRGYHFNALISPWVRWSELVAQHEAADTPERKKAFCNLALAEPWQEQALEVPEPEALMARAEPYPEGTVPAGGCFLTAGVDVQGDRLECEIVAWGRDYESWSVHYIVLHGDITEPAVWTRLDELLTRSWPHVSGMPMRLQAVCIDAGFSPAEVTAFTRHRHGQRVYATKGASAGWSRPIWPRRVSWDKNKHAVYLISSDEAKAWVANRLKIDAPGPGYLHFPISRERQWYEQLTAEKLVTVKGAKKWVKPHWLRNESFDCRALAVAALHSRLLANVDLNQWCDSFEKLLLPMAVSAKPNGPVNAPAPSVIRSRFVYG
jgi:phage terminase large subunit GpA-like protein